MVVRVLIVNFGGLVYPSDCLQALIFHSIYHVELRTVSFNHSQEANTKQYAQRYRQAQYIEVDLTFLQRFFVRVRW